MIDLHSHVLYGVDDGARTLEDSVAIARGAAADGVRVLAATPHVRIDYPTTPHQMEERLAEVRQAWPLDLDLQLFELQTRGFRTVLAHPERNADVASRPERLRPLVEGGALVQVTAGSLDGRLGRSARQTGLALLELGLVHLVGTDVHDASGRSGLGGVAESVGDAGLARWLTLDAPAAILAGEAVPATPRARAARGRGPLARMRSGRR